MNKKIKKYAPLAALVLAVIVIILAIISISACNVQDSLSVEVGKYKAISEDNKKEKEKLQQEIDEYAAAIQAKDKEIADIKADTVKKKADIQQKNNDLVTIEKKKRSTTSDSEKLILFQDEVNLWVEKFNLSQNIIYDKDKEISAWAVKYSNMEVIAGNFKKCWDNAEVQAAACEAARSQMEKSLKKTRFFSKVKTVALAACVGYIAYSLVKK